MPGGDTFDPESEGGQQQEAKTLCACRTELWLPWRRQSDGNETDDGRGFYCVCAGSVKIMGGGGGL